MRKITALLLVGVMAFSITACTTKTETNEKTTTAKDESKPETVTITGLNANKENVEVEVPYDPQRIAILDLAALDIIDNLGMGERVVGTADTSIEYLASYAEDDDLAKLGTIKEADLEAVMACEPDVIFIGGRLSASYDDLSKIAPVVYLATDTEIGVVESTVKNATAIASIFGLEDEIAEKTQDFTDRIAALQTVSDGKTAIVGMTTSGSFNLLGNDGRCSIIGREIGFDNVGVSDDADSSSHGNESSFETVVSFDPDYVFVMDRDSAIGTEGAQLAKDIMENELVMGTNAYKNGNVIYLENPAVWYTAEGGITALDMMLTSLETAFIQ